MRQIARERCPRQTKNLRTADGQSNWQDKITWLMNRSSTHLTSDPTRVMFLTGQQPDSTAAALNKFCSICTPNGVYTEFGIDPLADFILPESANCFAHYS